MSTKQTPQAAETVACGAIFCMFSRCPAGICKIRSNPCGAGR